MRTYQASYEYSWGRHEIVTVTAPSFLEAWNKVKKLMKKTGRRCTLLSLVQTAKLNA